MNKRLDHLGLIAAFCHEVDLPDIIDRIIPKFTVHSDASQFSK
ncbi:hypothetical protein VCRA2113O120_40085 [Vibrio crassostreae]|nr:hypothetical protein VCRA2113O120_40085 [Vibrio crassostreae]CAK3511360.1 hypothetical protein VCRA2123E130_40162 [Vibrio crassostreae]